MVAPALAPEEELNATTIDGAIDYLKTTHPEAIKLDDREGYEGIIVDADRLVDIGQIIRDDLGFDYLSSATAVDYLGAGDHMEMVYHAYRTSGGGALVFKAQTDRENAVIPSLASVWRGADFQEREAWDLFGIRFPGLSQSQAHLNVGRLSRPSHAQGLARSLLRRRSEASSTAVGPAVTCTARKRKTSLARTFPIRPISTSTG